MARRDDDPIPPISLDETLDILGRLAQLVDTAHEPVLVLIGGQALTLWASHLTIDVDISDLASNDLDFQGNADAVRNAARLLGGEHRVSTLDDHTTQAGAVSFQDRQGHKRVVDFLSSPFGLTAEDVEASAVPFTFDTGDRAVTVWIMHPERCLRSRVANHRLPGRASKHADAQLHAAIALVPAFMRQLLDDGHDPRHVSRLNERIYDLAINDNEAQRLALIYGIDVADAVLHDERLPAAHLSIRLPQLRAQLDKRRAHLARTWNLDSTATGAPDA